MTNTWTAGGGTGTITLSGAGYLSNNQYTGDGHVIGSGTSTTNVVPLTLGSTNGGVQHALSTSSPDNYIVNNPSTNTTIHLHFSDAILGVRFDYQIFPDGTCPNPTSSMSSVNLGCTSPSNSNWPDFNFYVDGTAPGNLVFSRDGVVPVDPNDISQTTTSERAPQFLSNGTTMANYTFAGGVHDLYFVDWPARIGIDNLVIECCKRPPQDAPEPGGLALFGVALAGLAAVRRRIA